MNDHLNDLALLHAAGALDGDELNELKRLLQERNEQAISLVRDWHETMTAVALHAQQPSAPPLHTRRQFMRRIQELHASQRSTEGPGSARLEHADGIYTIYPDRLEWRKHPVPGVWFKVLSESTKRGYVTMLMKVEPGTVFPDHHHSGEEECYVLSGSIILNGKRLGPGVLHHGDEGSDHDVLSSEEGALLLLVVSREDYIPPVNS